MIQATQMIIIQVDGHEFKSPMKRAYQTFFRNKSTAMKYNGKWKSVELRTAQEKRQIVHLSTKNGRDAFLTDDQIVLTPNGCRFVKDLTPGSIISVDSAMGDGSSKDIISAAISVNQTDDWLFGVKVTDVNEPYFSLENGMVLRGEL